MADVTANFTVFKGNNPRDLKHVVTVLKQSNFRDALQLVKQHPYNKNIFVNPRENKSIAEFLVLNKPMSILELAPIVLLFFTSNFILTNDEFKEFSMIVNGFRENNNSKQIWENKWASLQDEKFLNSTKPYIHLIESRIKTDDYHTDISFDNSPFLQRTYFKSQINDESLSMIAYDTNLLIHDWKKVK